MSVFGCRGMCETHGRLLSTTELSKLAACFQTAQYRDGDVILREGQVKSLTAYLHMQAMWDKIPPSRGFPWVRWYVFRQGRCTFKRWFPAPVRPFDPNHHLAK